MGTDDERRLELPLCVPAWCDLKRRTIVFDWTTFHVGSFVLTDEAVAYTGSAITGGDLVMTAPLRSIAVRWSRMRMTHQCDLTTSEASGPVGILPPTTFRFFFVRPNQYAPPAARSDADDKLAEALSKAQIARITGHVGLGVLLSVARALPKAFRDDREQRRNGAAIRRLLEPYEVK
jgi:hypothetical protein